MTALALVSVGPWVGSTGVMVATLPASRGAGNLLLAAWTCIDNAETLPNSVPGWGNPLYAYPGNIRAGLYGRYCTNTSADNFAPTPTGSTKKATSMACFSGDIHPDLASIVHASNYRATSASSTAMDGASLTVTSNDCLIVQVSRRSNDAVNSLTQGGAVVPSSLTYWNDGTQQISAWAYKQQTTATDIPTAGIKWTLNPGDITAFGTHSVIVALRTDTSGQVFPETVASTIVPSDDYVKSVTSGLGWQALPAVTAETGSVYTIEASRAATSRLYGVAVVRSSALPSIGQIKSGLDGTSVPAQAVNSSASGTGAVTLTLTMTRNPAYPLYDLHFVLSDGTLDSDVQTIHGPLLDPPADKLFKALASVSATGPLAGTLAAPGDVWVTAAVTSGAGAYGITLLDTADFQIAASGDTDRVQFEQKLYDWSAATYEGPGTVYVNNAPPTPATPPIYPSGLLLEQNATITPINMASLAPDPESDTITVTKTDGSWPPGLSMGGSPNYTLSGTPTEYGEWTVTLRWTDTLGEHYDESFDIITGPKLPDVYDEPLAQAQAELALASLTLAYDSEYHATIVAGNIISQTPAANTVVRYDAQVVLTVSLGPEP